MNVSTCPEVYSCRNGITSIRPRITWHQMTRKHLRGVLVDYSDDDTDTEQTGDGIKKRWLRQSQSGGQQKRIRSSSTDIVTTSISSTQMPDNSNIVPQSEVTEVTSTLSEAQSDSTTSDSQIDSTQSDAQNTITQPEAPETSITSPQQPIPDQNYYFVLNPEQVTNVVNYQAPPTYPYQPTYATLTPTVTYTNLNQFITPTVTYTAEPLICTQQPITQEVPAVAAEVTATEEVDHSLEINRYDHIYPTHDPNLRTTCYSSVGSDSDGEKIEPRRVRISMELLRATNLIQKKLAQRLDEFHASSSGSSTHTVLPEDHTESEVDRMLASSDEDTSTAHQAAQNIDISSIPPDFHFPPTENFQPIVENLIKENTKIDIYNIFKIIRNFPQLCIKLATQVHEQIAAGKQVPQSAKTFLYKNRSKVLYGQLEKHVKERHLSGKISWVDLSYTEVESFTLASPPTDQLDYERYRLGPIAQTITGEAIPKHIIKNCKAIIVAFSDVYTQLDDRYISNILNMAPGENLYYNGEDSPANSLLAYLRKVQEQVGEASLPLVVEFTPTRTIQGDHKLAMQMVKDFISTLAIFQKDYSGLVLALTCPPFYDRSYSLPAYQKLKGTYTRISEFLVAYGLCFGIFSLNPPIVSPPITGPNGFTGFFIEKSFCRAPLFTKIGLPTTEMERRAIRGLREELSYIRNLGFI